LFLTGHFTDLPLNTRSRVRKLRKMKAHVGSVRVYQQLTEASMTAVFRGVCSFQYLEWYLQGKQTSSRRSSSTRREPDSRTEGSS
jgi:hypothetical protein